MEKFDKKTQNLFDLNINPNINELDICDEENLPEPEEEIEIAPTKKKNSHKDVFDEYQPNKTLKELKSMKPKLKPKEPTKLKPIPEENVLDEQNDIIDETIKPLTYREKKKLEKVRQKELEKQAKEILREEKRTATQDRNREKARERYWENKKLEEERTLKENTQIKERIAIESKAKLNNFQRKEVTQKVNQPNNIDFAQFTEYMLKYETMKQQLQLQQQQLQQQLQKQKEQEKKTQPKHSPFPENYPIHLLYGNRKKSRNVFY
jgi:hypothetical protein